MIRLALALLALAVGCGGKYGPTYGDDTSSEGAPDASLHDVTLPPLEGLDAASLPDGCSRQTSGYLNGVCGTTVGGNSFSADPLQVLCTGGVVLREPMGCVLVPGDYPAGFTGYCCP